MLKSILFAKTIVLAVCLSTSLYAETLITLNEYELHDSFEAIESEAEVVVDGVIVSSESGFFRVHLRGVPRPDVPIELFNKGEEEHRLKLPHVISGPDSISVSAILNGEEVEISRDLGGAYTQHRLRITEVFKGSRVVPGNEILVNQPGSTKYDVVADGFPLMVQGQEYRLYLRFYRNDTNNENLPIYEIVGLNGGVLRKEGNIVYHEDENTTDITGRRTYANGPQ